MGNTPTSTVIKSPIPLEFAVKALHGNSCFLRIKPNAEFGSILITSGKEVIHVIPSKSPENALKMTVLFIKENQLNRFVTFENLPTDGSFLYNFKMNMSHVSSSGQFIEFNNQPQPYRGDHRFGVAFYQYDFDECGLMLTYVSHIFII